MSRSALLLLLTSVSCFCQEVAPPVPDLFEAKLVERVRAIDAGLNGVLGVYAIDLTTGRVISWHGDSVFPQASSIKIPIMIEVFRQAREGRVKLDAPVTMTSADIVGGSGHLRLMLASRPLTLTVEELVTAMISTSDNTATNRILSLIGKDNVNANLDRLGFGKTRLRRIMLDTAAAARDEENVSTPSEMARIMELIYREKAVDAAASKRMLEILKLPEAAFRAAVPSNVAVAAKPGELTGVHCETGVVFVPGRPFVLSVAGTFLGNANPVQQVVKLFYDYFATLAKSNRYGNGGVR